MTTPIDLTMPRSTILKFPNQTAYVRALQQKGTLQVPAGVTMVQIFWTGDARLAIFTEKDGQRDVGTLVNAWTGAMTAPSNGEYPYFRIVSSQSTYLVIQGAVISTEDLSKELAVNFITMVAG